MPALDFGSTLATRVNVGATFNPSAITIAAWVRRDASSSNNLRIVTCLTSGGLGWGFGTNSTTGNLRWVRVGTSSQQYITNDTPVALGEWTLVALAATWASSAHIYTATVENPTLVESTYGTSANGSGSITGTTAGLAIGHREAAFPVTEGWDGPISVVGVWDRELSLAEIQKWATSPSATADIAGYWRLGDNGTGAQPDWSGNGRTGTVTDATAAEGPPIARWRRGRVLYVPVASAAPTSYTLTVDAATVTTTFADVALRHNRVLPVDAASVAVTANDVGLTVDRRVAVDAASVATTFADVALRYNRRLAVEAASVAVTASPVGLRYGRRLAVEAASVAVTLNGVGLLYGGSYTLTVDAASVAVTFADVALRYNRRLAVDAASVAVSMEDASLLFGRRLAVDAAGVAITLEDVGLVYGQPGAYTLPVDAFGVSAIFADVRLRYNRRLAVDAASVTTALQDIALRYSRLLSVEAASVAVTLRSVGLNYSAANSTDYRVTDRSGMRYRVTDRTEARYRVTDRTP